MCKARYIVPVSEGKDIGVEEHSLGVVVGLGVIAGDIHEADHRVDQVRVVVRHTEDSCL